MKPSATSPIDDAAPEARGPGVELRPVPDEVVIWAARMIDSSELVERIATWEDEERRAPGGRPKTFPDRALLVAMLVCAVTDGEMLAARFCDVLFRRISPAMRDALGVPPPPGPLDAKGWDAVYRNVRTRFHGIVGLMDPSPTPKNRRLSHDRFLAMTELRRTMRSEDEWAERYERLWWFCNQLIEMSIRMLPRSVRRRWKGSAAVDATVVPASARPDRRGPRRRGNKPGAIITHSADPDAAWYVRGRADARDADKGARPSVFGYELSIVVAGNDDPDLPQVVPCLVMGMAPLHKPSHAPGQNAAWALRSIHERGHPAGFLAGDLAYTNAKPEDFQLVARSYGYRPVLSYKTDQLGIQDSYLGMLLIEGAWYCPEIPEVLIDATVDFAVNKSIDEATYRTRLEERWRFRILSKTGPDGEGHTRMRCPAANPNPVARCARKPRSEIRKTQGKLRIPVRAEVQAHWPVICTQESITVPPDAGAKYAQDLLYGSDEHQVVYNTLRNSIEGVNGFMKNGAHEALDEPDNRRILGVAPQSLFVAFLICAANIPKIQSFLAEQAAVDAGTVTRLPRRRRTRSLESWRPDSTGPAVPPDPHPPPGEPIISPR